MKIRRIQLQNVRSFKENQTLEVDKDISILVGPNGGGKSNLLDALHTTLRNHIIPTYRKEVAGENTYRFNKNAGPSPLIHQRHSNLRTSNQTIILEIEATEQDVINMQAIKTTYHQVLEKLRYSLTESPYINVENWDIDEVIRERNFSYTIFNEELVQPNTQAAWAFFDYLQIYEKDSILREDAGDSSLVYPVLFFPANRIVGFSGTTSLHSFQEENINQTLTSASSRSPSNFVPIAIGKLAKTFRFLLERDDGSARKSFNNKPSVIQLRETLENLGYQWDLICKNPLQNSYEVIFSKHGARFTSDESSSGEKEFFTYLFTIFSLEIRDALLIIDEPEVHLHPHWQYILFTTFEALAKETGCQFIIATHSATFISPSSIEYVSRVFNKHNGSYIVNPSNYRDLPITKHLLSIVKAENNEKIFFASKVILVEGISDKILFEALLKHFEINKGLNNFIEIIYVTGKTIFQQYEKILKKFEVPYAIIADFDYLKQIGSQEIKALFKPDNKKTMKTIKDPTSADGRDLIEAIENSKSVDDLEEIKIKLENIKARRSIIELKDQTSKITVHDFINKKRQENIFILKKGSIEQYLPTDLRKKDIEQLIEFVKTKFFTQIDEDAQLEFTEILQALSKL